MAHAKFLQKLARFYGQTYCRASRRSEPVANFKSGTVVIHADNGAVAVKLRQMGPSLTREFSSRGIGYTGVTVKVQALIYHQSRSPEDRPLPEGARRNLGRLAKACPRRPCAKRSSNC